MDNIRVAIRVRPLNLRETTSQQQQQSPWIFENSSITQLSLSAKQIPLNRYTFDHIYTSDAPTQSLYDEVARGIVNSVMEGMNGTIFAYGQTSSGKTFTMKGVDERPGIIPLAISDIFKHINTNADREFLLRVSYLEIYNEVIQDLLNPEGKNLKIHEDLDRGIFVGNLKEEIVSSPQQVINLMKAGEGRRQVGATNMNEQSSRSHTIFRMVIERYAIIQDNTPQIPNNHQSVEGAPQTQGVPLPHNKTCSREHEDDRGSSFGGAVKVSLLNLVDLAGSERIAHTGAEGMRLKEGGHINKSLLTLSTVIAKLSEGQRGQHIPYRDSKLTRILQTALGGNALTAIICTVTPAVMHQEETVSTLNFARRAKNIKNKPIVNEVMDDAAMLRKYKEEIHNLKKQLAEVKEGEKQLITGGKEDEKLAEQLEILKRAILHSDNGEPRRNKPKRAARRETWCPGEGGVGGPSNILGSLDLGGQDSEFAAFAKPPASPFALPPRKRHFNFERPAIPAPAIESLPDSLPPSTLPPIVKEEVQIVPIPLIIDVPTPVVPQIEEPQDDTELFVLREEVAKLQCANSEALQEVERLQSFSVQAQEQIAAILSEKAAIQQELENLHNEHGCLQRDADASYNEAAELRDVLYAAEVRVEELQAQQQDLVAQLEEAQNRSYHCDDTEEYKELENALQVAVAQCEKLNLREQELLSKLYDEQEKAERCERLELEVQERTQRYEQVESEARQFAERCAQLETCIQKLAAERDALYEDNNTLKAMDAEYLELKEHCEELNNEVAKWKEYCEQLETERPQLVAAAQKVDQLAQERDELSSVVSDLKAELNIAKEIENARQTQPRVYTETANLELKEARDEIAALHNKLSRSEQQLSASQSHYSSHDQLAMQLDQAKQRIEQVEAEAEQLRKDIKAAEQDSQKASGKLRVLDRDAAQSSKKAQQLQTSLDLCRQQCDTLNARVNELVTENKKLEGKLHESASLIDERRNLLDNVSRLKADLSQASSIHESQRGEILALQRKISQLEGEVVGVKQCVEEKQNRLLEAEENIRKSQNEGQLFRKQMEERDLERQREQRQFEALRVIKDTEMAQLNEQLAAAQSELEAAASSQQILRRELAQLSLAARDYERVTTELAQQKTRYSADMEKWKEEVLKLKKEVKGASSAEKERETMLKEMDKLKQKIEVTEAKLKQATQDKTAATSDKASVEGELKQIRKQNVQMEREMEKLKAADNKTKETAAALATITKTYEGLTKAHDSLTKAYEKLKLDLDMKVAELQKDEENIVRLELAVADLHTANSTKDGALQGLAQERDQESARRKELEQILQLEYTRSDEVVKRLEASLAQGVEYEAQLAALAQASQEQLTQLANQLKSTEEERDSVYSELTDAHYKVEEHKAVWAAKEHTYLTDGEALRKELDRVRGDQEDTQFSLSEARQATEVLTQEKQALESDVAKLQNMVQANESNLSKLQAALTSLEADKQSLQSEIQRVSGLLEAMEANAAITAEQIAQLQQDVARVEGEKLSAQTESAQQIARMSHASSLLETENKELKNEITALQQMLDKLDADKQNLEMETENMRKSYYDADSERQAKLEKAEEIIANITKEHEEEKKCLLSENSKLESNNQSIFEQATSLRSVYLKVEEERKHLHSEVTRLYNEKQAIITQVNEQIAGWEQEKQAFIEQTSEQKQAIINQANEQISRLDEEKQELYAEVTRLREFGQIAAARADSLVAAADQGVGEKQALYDEINRLKEVNSKMVDPAWVEQMKGVVTANINKLKGEVEEAQSRIQQLQTDVARKQQETDELRESLGQAEEQIATLSKQANRAPSEIEQQLQDENSELLEKLDSMVEHARKTDSLQSQLTNHKNKIADYINRLHQSETRCKKAEAEVETLKQQLATTPAASKLSSPAPLSHVVADVSRKPKALGLRQTEDKENAPYMLN